MSAHFSRSLRTIEADTATRQLAIFAVIISFVAVWTWWFTFGRVAMYAASSSARLEVNRESHPMEAVVGGRIVELRVAVGQPVNAGDVILELDANPERLARSEEVARLAPVLSQLRLLDEEL